MKNLKKILSVVVPVIAMSMLVATPAHADDVFDRVRTITTKLPVIKEAAIYLFFLVGLGGVGWGGMEMLKKSKNRGGEDTTWGSIGLKFIAGAILVAVTATTDTMTQTVMGSSASNSTSNIQ